MLRRGILRSSVQFSHVPLLLLLLWQWRQGRRVHLQFCFAAAGSLNAVADVRVAELL